MADLTRCRTLVRAQCHFPAKCRLPSSLPTIRCDASRYGYFPVSQPRNSLSARRAKSPRRMAATGQSTRHDPGVATGIAVNFGALYSPYLRCSFRMHLSITTTTPPVAPFPPPPRALRSPAATAPESPMPAPRPRLPVRHRGGEIRPRCRSALSCAASLSEGYAFSPSTSLSFGLIGTTRYPLLWR